MHDGDVDAPAAFSSSTRARLEEVAQRRLRRAVAALQRDASIRERRLDRHERPLRLAQVRQHGPVAVDLPEEVDVHDPPQLVGLVAVRLRVDRDDRVRDIRVDPPEAVDRLLDHLLHLVLHRAVGRDGERLRAERLDLAHARVERLAVAGGDDDLRAALAGEPGDGAAEPARGARDEDHLLGQRFLASVGHRSSLCPETGYATHMPKYRIRARSFILAAAGAAALRARSGCRRSVARSDRECASSRTRSRARDAAGRAAARRRRPPRRAERETV